MTSAEMSELARQLTSWLLRGVPAEYNRTWPVDGPYRIPQLNRVDTVDIPSELVAFDNLDSAKDPKTAAIMFYKNDYKFARAILFPGEFANRAVEFRTIICPDISISGDMDNHKVISNTLLSRGVGAVFQSRGFIVIPNLRWRTRDQIQFVTHGITEGSVIAASMYGNISNKDKRYEFTEGLRVVIELLKPKAVLVYGARPTHLASLMGYDTEFHFYPSRTSKQHQDAQAVSNVDLKSQLEL